MQRNEMSSASGMESELNEWNANEMNLNAANGAKGKQME